MQTTIKFNARSFPVKEVRVVNSLEDKDYLIIEDIQILDGLILDPLIADIKPIGKVLP